MLRGPLDAAGPPGWPFASGPDAFDATPAAPSPAPAVRRRFGWWRLARWAICAALLLLFVAIGWLAVTAPLSRSLEPIAPPSVTLLATNGSVIARRGAIVDRPVDVRKLPAHVGNAFIAIEDRRFYHHWGIDPHGIARAAWHNLRGGGVREGGSTITQQLAKLVFLNADRTMGRKAREVLIAFWMEAWLTKDDILSRYLSDVYFGDNVYGLRAAARHYFDKAPEDLSIGEAAMLAGLMKAPSRLAPSTNWAGAQARARLVMAAMVDGGFLTADRAARAVPARLHLRATPVTTDSTYFADWVLPAARERIGTGYSAQTIRTTLDATIQRKAEAAVARAQLGGAQVALVAMRPDGRVVAMVGGRHYGDSPFNRAAQAQRQPGSTFKLFVYLAALRSGMTPDDRIEDEPLTIGAWSPANADRRYRGLITLREAFARSSNVAAVRLARKVGPEAVVRAARDLGITSPLAADPSIALGTSTVSLLELTSAYAAVAGQQWPVRPHGLPDVDRTWFQSLWNRPHHLDDRQHAMLLDLLSATVKSGTARAAALSTQVYGKTGTTQNNRDAIFVGFANGLVTAVWVGRDDNKALPGMAGGGLPAKIWRGFMADALGLRPVGARAPAAVDPDAGLNLDFGDTPLGNLNIGVHLDGNGLHISNEPRRPDEPPPPPEDEGDGPPGNEPY